MDIAAYNKLSERQKRRYIKDVKNNLEKTSKAFTNRRFKDFQSVENHLNFIQYHLHTLRLMYKGLK